MLYYSDEYHLVFLILDKIFRHPSPTQLILVLSLFFWLSTDELSLCIYYLQSTVILI